MRNTVKSNLAQLRAANGKLTLKKLAMDTGLSQKTLSDLEQGTSTGIEFKTLARLCQFFNCAPGDILIVEYKNIDSKPSSDSLAKADKLIADELQKVIETPPMTPEEIWDAFDDVRARIQSQVDVL